jgi:hypothetical protein
MTIFAAFVILFLVVVPAALLERNHRRNTRLPQTPYGSDLQREADLWRTRHDLDVARPAH